MSRTLIAAFVCFASLGLCQFATAQATVPARAQTAREKEQAPVPVPLSAGRADLIAENTTIQFVGTHLGDKPDPRTGYFTEFTGELVVDESQKAPAGISVEIETASLVTAIDRLTGHLKSPDFFDARQFPNASFKSTKVEPVDMAAGKYKVTGDLTLRDVTKPISFPATLKLTDAGAVLTNKFKIKRSEFGMTFGPDRVADEVALTVTVGKPTPDIRGQ